MNPRGHDRRTFIGRILSAAMAGATGMAGWTLATANAVAEGLERIAGQIIHRDDARYPSWWSSMTWYIHKPERYPDLIVRAGSEKDVVETIHFARNNGLRIAVRSTGHNPARATLRDGGVLLDLSTLRSAEIDPDTGTAWIQPGVRAQELLRQTTPQGFAFPAAHTGIVGLGGYLLGGGLGWNMPEYGIACRSVLGAEIVLADGSTVFASADENPDLHWAIRGVGPGFFGAVVRYKLQLHPLHRAIHASSYVIPVERLDEALEALAKIGHGSDQRLELLVKIGRFHPVELPYAQRDLVCTVSAVAFADSEDDARALMAPVSASRLAELSVATRENDPVGYEQLYVPPETDHTSPGRTAVENMWTGDPGKALRSLTDRMIAEPPRSPRSFLLCGWSFNSTFEDPGSCVRTAARHYVSWYMIADRKEDILPNDQWMDEAVALMQPLARGRYINEIDPLRYPRHVEECFEPADWQRLQRLRREYDPQGVFHGYLGRDDAAQSSS